jgi:Glycosyl hydrolases family 2, sugar binding domain/Glycosyl hydrolases family 2/Glycosyl hydrolases family 2, TIM barrel domain
MKNILFAVSVFLAVTATLTGQKPVSFPHVFSPQEGLTKPVEQPWRQEICLNGSWQFQPVALPADYTIKNGTPQLPAPVSGSWSTTPIRIPSPWNINAFSYSGGVKTFPAYPAEWETARMGWLRRSFRVPANWQDKRIILHFEAVCGSAQVFVNGEQVAEHFDNSLPFSADITDFVQRDGENTLLVGVRQATLFNVPGMFGQHTYPSGSPWTRQMTGIWQDVYLRSLPPVRVDDIAVRPLVDQGVLELEVTVRNSTGSPQQFSFGGNIVPWINQAGTDMISAPVPRWSLGQPVATVKAAESEIGPRTTKTLTIQVPVKDELKSWTPETPNLYALVVDILQDGKTEDRFYQRFGWRQWGIQGRNVTLNGKTYQLLGESGHLLGVPYMTRRYAWSWYKAIKDLNGNAIRLHANLRPRFYLELADEMGIAILDESEIYASTMEINYHAPETWQRFHDHIDGMVLRDRNYPSVFGWSIANEILSAIWWKGTPRKFWPPVIDKVVALADRIKVLDPTRPWISSDGDGDFHGRLPIYIYHYGKPQDWNRQAPKDKPFGIGEGGSMLWGSPAVFSAYNGERSFESRLGMQEGTAIEIYWYLTEQRKISAFTSVFTIAGSCFEPFHLSGRAIMFGPFTEGQPGMQPEQMGSFGLNFNPGYDPAQPFYKTTPVFDAVKAAYAPGGPAPSPWDHRVQSAPRPVPPAATIKKISFIGDAQGDLKKPLESSGVVADAAAKSNLLVIDGATLTEARISEARSRMQEILKQHGTVFIWAAPENLTNVNTLLPATITLVPQSAFGLFADRKAPETAPLALADLYFGDQSDKTILKYGITGPLVQRSRTLIESNSIAQRWFENTDETRVPALISIEQNGGRVLVTSLSPDVRSERRLKLMRSLFANLGVALSAPTDKYNTGFDGAGFLNQALVIGSFQGALYPQILDIDFIGNEAQSNPKPGDAVRDRIWKKTAVLGDGLFDFFRLGIPGTEGSRARAQGPVLKPEALDANNYLEVIERVSGTNPGTNSVVYVSFWINVPHKVDTSQLTMQLRSDDGVKVWVNEKQIFEEHRIYGPGMTDPKPIPIALNAGWNHVLVKIGQLDGPWTFSAKFESNEPGLVKKLQASAISSQASQ